MQDGETVQAGSPVVEALDTFQAVVRSFLDSRVYQMPRIVPYGLPEPSELPSIHDIEGLTLFLREAVLSGDREKTLLVSANISSILVRTMLREGETNQPFTSIYSRLLLLSSVIIVLIVIAILFLGRVLSRSLRHREESSAFSRAVLLAQEEERTRIYGELNGTIVEDLCYLSMNMDRIGATDERAERKSLCLEAQSIQAGIIDRVRNICYSLAPLEFGMRNLPDTLRQLCFDFGNHTGIVCRMVAGENSDPDSLSDEQGTHIFRIVQEALANVGKHANAKEAIVELQARNDGGLSVTVSDDGVGFESSGGIRPGIQGMKERAILLGGSLAIGSKRGKGTQICLLIPPSTKIFDNRQM